MPAIKCKQNNLGLGSTRRRTDFALREKAEASRERQWLFSFETQTVDRYYILYFYNSAIVIDLVQRKEGMSYRFINAIFPRAVFHDSPPHVHRVTIINLP